MLSFIVSGGTKVTVIGSHLHSVAEPRISLSVITTRAVDSSTPMPSTTSNSEVLILDFSSYN